jgi:alpha-L-fucosidase
MKIIIALTLQLLILSSLFAQNPEPIIPQPTPAQIQWQTAELAALVCIDLHAFDGKFYVQKENHYMPVDDYNIFNPQHYDTDQWIRSLKEAGFKIAILTVSHESGFFFHQSDATPYCMKALKWRDGKGDVLRDFVASCRKYDIKPGVYVGTRFNSFFGVIGHKVVGEGELAENRQKLYYSMIERILEEIFTSYGDWAILWFDGGVLSPEQGGPEVLSMFKKYQPNCLFYSSPERADMRWGGSETGTVPYPCWGTWPWSSISGPTEETKKKVGENNRQLLKTGDPYGRYYMPAMSDAPLRGAGGGHDWFWEPDREHTIYPYPLDDLVDMYYNSVGHNSTLILGLTPNPDGLLPEADAMRLKEWGDELNKRFSRPVAQTSGKKDVFQLKLDKGQLLNHVVLQEDIGKGERVREFVVEGRQQGKWIRLCEGSCIGNKFIGTFEGTEVSLVRLRIAESMASPHIKQFSVYYIEE